MNKINYFSTDKLYKIRIKKLNKKAIFTISIVTTMLLLIVSGICFKQSVKINSQDGLVKYSENGNIDYKIYLKDNNYYESSYLGKGMQYVASLIKTINVNFNYEIHSNQDMDFNTKYKVIGELQITEKDDSSKILYSKKENLINEKVLNKVDNNFVINEEVDIDYDKYNDIVNSYKRDYGLIVSSNLILTLEVNTNGKVDGIENELNNQNKLQLSVPLSEQTVNIRMDSEEIDNNGAVLNSNKLFIVSNKILFIVFIVLVIVSIVNIILDIYLYLKYFKKDIYKAKVSKILKEYDRLIINGKVSIDENKYTNKIYPESFEEMVDAAQQLETPIYYYEVISNEKCFFIIAKDDTLYKYRLTRAFLEKEKYK